MFYNVEQQVEAGASGVIIGGSLGESSTISWDERIQMTAAALIAVGDRADVIMNIAEGSTQNALALAKKAEVTGAHGLMLLPPMMYRPTEEELIEFFKTVASHSSLPILLYNNPVDYKVEITLPIFDALQDVPTIQAVKESTRDISNVTRMKKQIWGSL